MFENIYDYEAHVKFGERLDESGSLPSTFMLLDPPSHHADVWDDVVRMRTLNGNQKQKGLNNHICPLQIDIVDRIITRYSNIGDTVYDPFGGLMTVPYRAVTLKRKGIGCELNPEYFSDGLTYLAQADKQVTMPTLFDVEKMAA
jgi:DNA modification methylase